MLNRGSVVPFFPSRASRCIVAAPGKPASLRKVVTSSAVAPPFRDSSSASSFPAADASAFVIRPPRTDDEFYSIAELRAEAYYADQPGGGGRFVESYKKQFREQEARSLRERVAPRRKTKGESRFLKGSGGGLSGGGGGGGGGVLVGVLGALVGRAASSAADSVSSLSPSSETEKGDAELLLPPECACLAAVEVAAEEGRGAEQEEEETARTGDGGPPPSPAPLAPPGTAAPPPASVVLGALDIRPPSSAGGGHPAGVPLDDERGCAVLNVAVHPSSRRRGVARALLSSAADLAAKEWSARALYTTVAATNAGARALYADFGFVEVEEKETGSSSGSSSSSSSSSSSPPTLVGRELLLRAEL